LSVDLRDFEWRVGADIQDSLSVWDLIPIVHRGPINDVVHFWLTCWWWTFSLIGSMLKWSSNVDALPAMVWQQRTSAHGRHLCSVVSLPMTLQEVACFEWRLSKQVMV
jgi:hypothetical protein